jgi:hypothetical protein
MFCDLVGSTALSVRFDPEELREEIRAYQNAVSGVVARYDGFVAKFMGDGVLAYFGYPRAHEDDAERAVTRSSAEELMKNRPLAREYGCPERCNARQICPNLHDEQEEPCNGGSQKHQCRGNHPDRTERMLIALSEKPLGPFYCAKYWIETLNT